MVGTQPAFPPVHDLRHQLSPHVHTTQRGLRAGEKLLGRQRDRVVGAEASPVGLGDQPYLLAGLVEATQQVRAPG